MIYFELRKNDLYKFLKMIIKIWIAKFALNPGNKNFWFLKFLDYIKFYKT